jgi:2-dehydropantoate 2-reductase
MSKTRIVVAGIGGVGGYFGGLLAKNYEGHENVEICFLARGQHLAEIRGKGLRLIHEQSEILSNPFIATDNPAEMGVADLIVICTKSYDLESVAKELEPCINRDTIILPLLNGTDSTDRIRAIYPDNLVLNGCVYIVSRIKEPGVVENTGNIQTLYFGLDNDTNDRLKHFDELFARAGIEATLTENISSVIWEKFIFLSPIATVTSYYDKCIGDILSNAESLETVVALIAEVMSVAIARGIEVAKDIQSRTMQKYASLPYETTSSMHRDFISRKRDTELQTLTGNVVEEGRRWHVPTPVYERLFKELEGR